MLGPLGLIAILLLSRCGRNEPDTGAAALQAGLAEATVTPTIAPAAGEDPAITTVVVTATSAVTGTEIPQAAPTNTLTPTATPTPLAVERLAQGIKLHRFGDYAAARSEFAAVLAAPEGDLRTRLQARYELARAYLADGSYGEALDTLNRLDEEIVASGSDPNEFATKDQFLRAEALRGQRLYSEAIAAYWRFLESYPWMAEVVQQRIAAAYRAAGDNASAAAAYRRAADAASDLVARVAILEDLAKTYSSAGQYAEAVAVYDEILASAQNAGYRAEIHYRAGQALASNGDLPGAVERWKAATTEAPEASAAYSALIELVNRNIDFDLYMRGYIDLHARAYLPAINAFQAYLSSVDVTDSRYGLALHGLGQSYLGVQNYAAALPVLDRVIAEFATCTCFGQAWLDKAAALAGMGDSVGARRTYRTLAREHSGNPLAPEALWMSGLQALREGNRVEAATDFLTLADAFPQSERAPAALYALGLGATQSGLHSQAAEIYQRMQNDYPEYKWDAVAYWLGRAYEARGETAQAQAQWQKLVETAPDIYYGVLAAYSLRRMAMTGGAMLAAIKTVAGPASRLEGDDGSQAFAEAWLETWIEHPEGSLSALPSAVAEDADLRVGRLLLALEQRGDALIHLERVFERYRDNPQALYALSLEFERIGTYRLSIMSAQRLLEFSPARLVEETPIFIQRRSYPRHFAELIEKEARLHNLDPLLFYSTIRQESLFEEGARSYAAAQGLAQIIPDTGQWVAEQLGYPNYTNDLIYRPHINLKFGAYYLDWVRDFTANNLVSGLVGYNAGPGNSQHWREISGPDDTLFIEILNVNEPRLYVQIIVSNLYHYTRLYG